MIETQLQKIKKQSTLLSPLKLKRISFLQYLIFGLGLFAALRFSTGGLFAYSCVLTYLIAIIFIFKNDLDKSVNVLLLSLFCVSDYGNPYYNETIPIVKYIIILTILTIFLAEAQIKITLKTLFIIFILLTNLSLTTLLQYEHVTFDMDIFKRDLQILFLIILGICTKTKYIKNYQLLFIGILGYFIGEILNYFFFHHDINEYMNYSSLKAIVFLPLIVYFGQQGKFLLKSIFLILSFLIMSEYGTRLIIVTWLIWFMIWMCTKLFLFPTKSAIKRIIFILFLFLSFGAAIGASLPEETSSKTLNVILLVFSLFNEGSLILSALDPVRYAEHLLFFNRPIYQIIFGSGLGSGIIDSNDILYFVAPHTGAFSISELKNNIFFNFHDIWLDFTLRFGLLPIIYLFFYLTVIKIRRNKLITSFLLTTIAICSTYSTAGLVVLFIITKKIDFDVSRSVFAQKNKNIKQVVV